MNDRKPIPLGTLPYEKGYVAGRAAYDDARSRTIDAAFILRGLHCDAPQDFVGCRNEDEYREGFYAAIVDRLSKEKAHG